MKQRLDEVWVLRMEDGGSCRQKIHCFIKFIRLDTSHDVLSDSKLGHNPSFTWRVLSTAKKWLLKGCRWRIGDCKITKLWFDNWVPGHQSLLKDGNATSVEDENETINSIIDSHTRW